MSPRDPDARELDDELLESAAETAPDTANDDDAPPESGEDEVDEVEEEVV